LLIAKPLTIRCHQWQNRLAKLPTANMRLLGVGNLFIITGRMDCALSAIAGGRKIN